MSKLFKKYQFFAGLLSVLLSVFLVAVVTYAATTISANINTGGTVTMESASTTNDFWLGNVIADDDDSLFFDASGSEWIMWDDAPGEFDVSDDLNIGGKATSTGFWAGAGGTMNYVDMSNDIYVQDDVEIDSNLWVTGTVSTTAATTTDYLYIGADGTESTFDFSGGDLYVQGTAEIETSLVVGTAGDVISEIQFGTCNIADTSITASSTAYTECSGATGVAAGDNVFVTATSSLPDTFIVQAASSTVADVISIRILNTGNSATTDTGVHTFFWQAMR